ncbi:hypothetical protein LEMLEM_LOCUS16576 [Lemmus lemmus]
MNSNLNFSNEGKSWGNLEDLCIRCLLIFFHSHPSACCSSRSEIESEQESTKCHLTCALTQIDKWKQNNFWQIATDPVFRCWGIAPVYLVESRSYIFVILGCQLQLVALLL